MRTTICTLYEKDYHYGVGALVNSLCKKGFKGIVWVGYRGELPFWADPLETKENYKEFKVTEDCIMRFIEIHSEMGHLCCYKPTLMLDILEKYDKEAEAIFYFDPDIVLIEKWDFFEEWVENGVCLCEDVFYYFPSNHPTRAKWKKILKSEGLKVRNKLERYYNSGYLGVQRKHKKTIELWKDLVHLIEDNGITHSGLKSNQKIGRSSPFFHMDQDILNLAITATKDPLSTVGPEAMRFDKKGRVYLMYHSLGTPKPWQLEKPDDNDPNIDEARKAFWWNSQNPIVLGDIKNER